MQLMSVQCEQRRELAREFTVVEIGHAKIDASSLRVLREFGGARSTVPAAARHAAAGSNRNQRIAGA